MIKKLSLSFIFTLVALNLFSQTIVSTSPENKNVILEEYTGIHCVWCPSGHAIAQSLQDSNPNDVYLINIHVGGYAVPNGGEPDFRTPFGTAIANEAGVAFYPAGSVNRHVFSGGTSAMSRTDWAVATNTILDQSSYENIGVEAEIDVSTGELTVHAEAFYTDDSQESTNFLNIIILQNNTTGPQTGGNMGNNYNHMHRLVHMVTGQWGEAITTTTSGTFVDETFNYTIPTDYNGVPVKLEDIEIVAFITETHQELISGSGCHPSFINLPLDNDANVQGIEDINDQCGLDFGPRVIIQNNGNNPLTSVEFEYSVNSGASANYTWSGSIDSYQVETVQLPGIAYTIQNSNTVNVSIVNDDDNSNNDASNTFGETDTTSTNYLTLIFNTDDYGSDTTWSLKDPSGTVIYSGGPYENNTSINESINLQEGGCHEFRIVDTGGNGSGSVVLYDSESTVIYSSPGNYGSGVGVSFISDGILGNADNVFTNLVIYPNPASSTLNIDNAENSTIEVYDLLGRIILSKTNISLKEQINVSTLNAGTYLIRITNENKVVTDKFIINR